MLTALAAVVSIAVFGLPLVLLVDRHARGGLLVGLSYLYGSGLVYFALLLLSAVGVEWSLPVVQGTLIVLSGAAFFVALRARRARPDDRQVDASTPAKRRLDLVALAIDLPTLLTVAVFTWFATAAPLWQWDFWAIWGLKAKVFFESAGIDWAFLARPWNEFAHPDYPLLLTLQFDYFALLNGAWEERWVGLHAPAFVAALLLVVRHEVSRLFGPRAGAATALGAAALVVTPYVGLADTPMMAFAGAAFLLLERGLRGGDTAMLHGSLLLGLAASTKNEGIALVAVTLFAAFLTFGLRAALRLWPAVAVIAPWLAIRALGGFATDVASGPVLERLRFNLEQLPAFAMLVTEISVPSLVVLTAIGALFAWRALGSWKFTLTVVPLQFFAYIGVYLVTPHTVAWHIDTSWPRISAHLFLLLLLVVMQALAMRAGLAQDAASCRSSTSPQTNSAPPATS